jgi:hypothetical protein
MGLRDLIRKLFRRNKSKYDNTIRLSALKPVIMSEIILKNGKKIVVFV